MAMRVYVSDKEAAFFNTNKMGYADSIPTSGSYKVGDFIISSTQLNGIFGWVCTKEGTPGNWEVIGSGSGGGGGRLISINASKIVDTAVNQISLIELGLVADPKDKLLVHFNSMFLMENVDYKISADGNSITKLGGGSWNESNIAGCLFTFELLKNVENVDTEEIKLNSKLICEKNNTTVTGAVSEVNIGIKGFNKSKDILIVYKNAAYLIEGIDYNIDDNSSKIVSLNGKWNENNDSDYVFTFVVLKEVNTIKPAAVVDTDNIVDGAVTMDKLGNDVKQAINNASDIDLSSYDVKADVGDKTKLQTNAKGSLVDAVNELFQNANNGKELIANAIGEPLSATDTFSAMGEEIEGLLEYFRDKLKSIGVTDPLDGLNLKELIDKVKGPTKYSITKNLTGCTINNDSVIIEENSSYTATITANPNYKMKHITVTMGGVDVTSTAVSDYNINLKVTGDIVITATAEVNNPYPPGTDVNDTVSNFSARKYNPVTKTIPVGADGNYTLSFNYGPNISNQGYTASVSVRIVDDKNETVDSYNKSTQTSDSFSKKLNLKKGYKIEITASISVTTNDAHCNQVNGIKLIFNSL